MSGRVSYAMEQFFGGNFHPDWDLEASDWRQIVDGFAVGEQPDQLEALARDIDEFRESRSDTDLHVSVVKMGGFYDPRPENTYCDWLGLITDRLRMHAGAKNDSSISWDLDQFFGAYFHQDWDLEADDWEGVVNGYAARHPVADFLRTLADEIDRLSASRQEPVLKHFLEHTVGVDYLPDPLTYKQWLGQIAERLRQRANAIDTGSSSL